jgi:hypothetical protein
VRPNTVAAQCSSPTNDNNSLGTIYLTHKYTEDHLVQFMCHDKINVHKRNVHGQARDQNSKTLSHIITAVSQKQAKQQRKSDDDDDNKSILAARYEAKATKGANKPVARLKRSSKSNFVKRCYQPRCNPNLPHTITTITTAPATLAGIETLKARSSFTLVR